MNHTSQAFGVVSVALALITFVVFALPYPEAWPIGYVGTVGTVVCTAGCFITKTRSEELPVLLLFSAGAAVATVAWAATILGFV